MCKKSLLVVVIAGLCLMGCKDKDGPHVVGGNGPFNLPYSKLTPDQQKEKLAQESIAFLNEMNALKNSSAIEAIRHLDKLIGMSTPDFELFKEVNNVQSIFELSNVYGVFTWNNGTWTQTTSNTELTFIFPAKQGTATNNATLSVKAENSGVTFTEEWTDGSYEEVCEYDEWGYYCYWKWAEGETREIIYHLPKSVTGTISVNSAQVGKIEFAAEYKNNEETPVTVRYKITADGGYEWAWTADRAIENKVSMKLSRNGRVLLDGVANIGANMDNIISGEEYILWSSADATLKIMDNLMLAYSMDAKLQQEMENIDKWYQEEFYRIWDIQDNEEYYAAIGNLRKQRAEKFAKAYNDYMQVALVSTLENHKIADFVAKAEKDDFSWYYDDYYVVQYLKFDDETLIAADVYFSSVLDSFIEEWNSFISAFQ